MLDIAFEKRYTEVVMKDNISGLYLGTLLRQMMCGIVFFIPMTLWSQGGNWNSIVLWLQQWTVPGLIAFGVVAACIGTIIYHVEKNLWAYMWQSIRIRNNACARKWMWGLMIAGGIGVLVGLLYYQWPHWCIVIAGMFFLFLSLAICVPPLCVLCKDSNLVEHTQEIWRAASKLPDDLDAWPGKEFLKGVPLPQLVKLYEVKEIARREAGWADYIHCGQTSAFAWILGCLLVMQNPDILAEYYVACCGCECSVIPPEPSWIIPSMCGAIWLLGFEMLCEIHKQMHIDRLLADYTDLKTKIKAEA